MECKQHKFEPRYSHIYALSNVEVMELLSRVAPEDIGKTSHLLTNYTYLGDICVNCGETRHMFIPHLSTNEKDEFKRKIKI